MSMSISTAQARAKCGPWSSHGLGRRRFSREFSHRMALAICPHVHFDRAGSYKVWVAVSPSRFLFDILDLLLYPLISNLECQQVNKVVPA